MEFITWRKPDADTRSHSLRYRKGFWIIGYNSINFGSIEKGKLADIIAVDGDPTKDVNVMGKVKFVMKEGMVFKNE